MAAGFFEAGKAGNRATFELFVRRLPWNRNFVLAVGLAQAVEYLLNLRFTTAEIAFLKTLPQFERTPPEFFDMLAGLRFTGDLFPVREGTLPWSYAYFELAERGEIADAETGRRGRFEGFHGAQATQLFEMTRVTARTQTPAS